MTEHVLPNTPTGFAAVDRVLADVRSVDELPLEDHLTAYERMHDSLRAALDDRPEDLPQDQPDEPPDVLG